MVEPAESARQAQQRLLLTEPTETLLAAETQADRARLRLAAALLVAALLVAEEEPEVLRDLARREACVKQLLAAVPLPAATPATSSLFSKLRPTLKKLLTHPSDVACGLFGGAWCDGAWLATFAAAARAALASAALPALLDDLVDKWLRGDGRARLRSVNELQAAAFRLGGNQRRADAVTKERKAELAAAKKAAKEAQRAVVEAQERAERQAATLAGGVVPLTPGRHQTRASTRLQQPSAGGDTPPPPSLSPAARAELAAAAAQQVAAAATAAAAASAAVAAATAALSAPVPDGPQEEALAELGAELAPGAMQLVLQSVRRWVALSPQGRRAVHATAKAELRDIQAKQRQLGAAAEAEYHCSLAAAAAGPQPTPPEPIRPQLACIMEDVVLSVADLEFVAARFDGFHPLYVNSRRWTNVHRLRLYLSTITREQLEKWDVLPAPLFARLPPLPARSTLFPEGMQNGCLTRRNYCSDERAAALVATIAEEGSEAGAVAEAVKAVRKMGVRAEEGTDLVRCPTVGEAAAMVGSSPASFDDWEALGEGERRALLREVGAGEPDVQRLSKPLTEAQMRGLLGQSMDVATLLRHFLAHFVSTLAVTVAAKTPLVVLAPFNGRGAALEALVHLHLGGYAVLGEYIGIDIDPLGGAIMLAWFRGEQRRNPGKLDDVKVSVYTCDMEKLSVTKLYAILRAARGPVHIYIGGPPCLDLSRLNRNGTGLWGEFSRLWAAFYTTLLQLLLC